MIGAVHGGGDDVALRVLGPVALVGADGDEVGLAPQKREIVAVLAAAAGTTVATGDLVTALWDDDSLTTRHRLKSQMAQLRPLLQRGLSVEFRNGGYRLTGPLELLDSTRFEAMMSRRRDLAPADAARTLRAALALWRGDVPFANVVTDAVSTATWDLLHLREVAVLALADAEIALRHAADGLVLVTRLFDEAPAREDLVLRTAPLLALSGRAMDALSAVQRHREVLADKGAVISPDVAELEARILRHELPTSTASQGDRPGRGATVSTGWVPRRGWIDRLDAASRSGPVVLVGEPGVGKTVLTHLLERRLVAEGTVVVRAAAPAEPDRPMAAVAGVLEELHHRVPAALDAAAEEPERAAALARLRAGPSDPAAPITSRDLFVADLAAVVGAALDAAHAVLVMEDVHWLDGSSADVLAGVVARPGARVVMTSRPGAPEALVADGATVLELDGFDESEVDELLRQVLPLRGSTGLARDLREQTGGNPLFLALALDVLARGELGVAIPASVHQAVEERTAALSRVTLDALQVAALLGHSFPLPVLWRVRPRARHELASAVDERLVRIDEATQQGHFLHGLVADALAAMVPAGARVALHDELCRALVATDAPSVAVAAHAVGAATLDPLRAASACVAACRAQAAVYEWEQCIAWADRGLAVVAEHGVTRHQVTAELLALRGTARRRWSLTGSVDDLVAAADAARSSGAEALFVDVVTELCLHGQTTLAGAVHGRALDHLDDALTLVLPAAERARLCAAAATLLSTSDAAERGRALYLEAHALALVSDDRAVLRSVMMNAHLGLAHPGDLARRADAAERLSTFDDPEARWETNFLLLGLAQVHADRPLVERTVAELRHVTPLVRERERTSGLLQVETVHAFLRGALDDAAALADRSFATALEKYSASWAMSVYAALIFPIREAQGRVPELAGAVAAMVDESPDFVTWRAVSAYVAATAGDLDAVRRELGFVAAHDLALVPDTTWTAIATMLCRPVHAVRDLELATRLYAMLEPFTGQLTWNGLCTHGPVDMGLALLACTLDDDVRAHAHWDRAEELVARIGAPHLLWPPPLQVAPDLR